MQSPDWAFCKRQAARPFEEPVLMIRSTSSGSSRPNHMRSQIGSPKVVRPVDFSRLACGFHSVAKQAPFRIAFRVDFQSQNGPKTMEMSIFRTLCFASAFRAAKMTIPAGPQSCKSLVLPKQKLGFS